MKASELRALSDAELHKRLLEARRELFNLRFQVATRKLENVRRIREVRKDIARVLTVLGERERGAEPARAAG
jgi:large subunit ribosomal protein L29